MSSDLWSPILLLAATLWAVGCASLQESPEERLEQRMYAHYLDVGQVQTAVREGRLQDVAQPAGRLAWDRDTGSLPPEASPYLVELREAAELAARAEDMETAAQATARLGATCGACHSALDAGPRFVSAVGPVQGPSRADEMIRHLWASDRMWEGLLAPSAERWNEGARILSEHPMNVTLLPDTAQALAAELSHLGREALSAQSQDERVDVYAGLLLTCSGCHSIMGVGGGD